MAEPLSTERARVLLCKHVRVCLLVHVQIRCRDFWVRRLDEYFVEQARLEETREWREAEVSTAFRPLPSPFSSCPPFIHPSIPPSLPSLLFSFSFSFSSNFPSLSFFFFLPLFLLSSPSTSSSYVCLLSQPTGAHAHTSGGKTRSRGKGAGVEASAPRIKNCEITRKT